MISKKLKGEVDELVRVVLDQTSGYTSGPGFEAAAKARRVRDLLQHSPEMEDLKGWYVINPDARRARWYTGFTDLGKQARATVYVERAASYPTKEIAAQVAKRLNLNSMLGGWEVIPAEDVPKHQTPIR
jgi:hypothetical protein